MSAKNVTLKEKVNGASGNVLFPATTTPNVYDSAKSQALSQTLVDTPAYEALGFAKFSTATAYYTGDKVYKDNEIYRFIVDKTAGEWDVAKVEPWSIEQEIEEVDDAIRSLIPAQASADNKLADKAYVNDKVSTDTATFRGSFNLVTDLELTTEATQGQIATALGTAISGEDKNDYAFVQIPTSDATPTEIARIDRYKYTGLQWAFEYSLNNSGFTAEQWAAINSGITSSLVTAFNAKYDKPAGGIPASDMNTSTFDDEPTAGSDNLVKSGGVQNELVLGAVYDVSAKNPTAGPNNDGKWESLSVLLSDANLSTLIPVAVRKGGMSIKFVQSSDNKYVQYIYLGTSIANADFTNVNNWQKLNLEEEVDGIQQNIKRTVGQFEIGSINYLNGYDVSGTTSIRTGHIAIEDNVSFVIKTHGVALSLNGYLIKYLNGVYVGYESAIVTAANPDVVIKNVVKDNTFDSVRFRFSKSTDWTDEEVEQCECFGVVPNSVLDNTNKNTDKINSIIGYDVELEHGGIDYLKGNYISDTNSIRTKEYIKINVPKVYLIVDNRNLSVNFDVYIIKYNNYEYVGYGTNSVVRGKNGILIENDGTFNQFAIRFSRSQEITDAQLNNVSLSVTTVDEYAKYITDILDKRDYIQPKLYPGHYVHKDDGKLRSFEGWYYSDFVEVVPGESFYYAFWGAQSASLCAYDANMNFIQPLVYGIGEHIGEILVENPKIKYVRGCTNNNSYFVIRALKPYISAQNYVVGSQSIYLQGQERRLEKFLNVETRQVNTPWIKLEENHALPSDGIYIGRIGDDVVLSINGVIKIIS